MLIDLTGQRFGRLTVVSRFGRDHGMTQWVCKCDCGVEKNIGRSHLVSGRTRSCGCLKKETSKSRLTTHGLCGSREYSCWSRMIQRCTNKKDISYKNYGNRGITVCDRWMKFENFFEDMGHSPNGTSIDRIDNDRGYYLENCRWATNKEQSRNTRKNNFVTIHGKIATIAEWSELTGIDRRLISLRLRRGWNPVKAVNTKARRKIY